MASGGADGVHPTEMVAREDESPPSDSDLAEVASASSTNAAGDTKTVLSPDVVYHTETIDTGGGYPMEMVAEGNIDQQFICKICMKILMEPVQTDCGHRFCKACVNALIRSSGSQADCPSCMEEGEEDRGRLLADLPTPDNGIKREMYRKLLHVVCPDCQWGGTFKDMDQAHWKVCPQKPAWIKPKANALAHAIAKSAKVPEATRPRPNLPERTDHFRYPEASTLAALQIQTIEIMAATQAQSERQDKTEQHFKLLWQHLNWLKHQNQILLTKTPECPSYDATCLWKVEEYFKTKHQAVVGSCIKIFSPRFYTSRYGYSLIACVYLNGDGMGKGTHISIFLVICKGDYDALLPWPFAQKVTIQLLSQNGGQNLMEKFTPKGNSSSFQRPISDQNTPVGYQLFARQEVVEETFVTNDSLWVMVQVDTSGLPDPAKAMKK